ncbi:phage major capsid protein [Bauldia litoralis]|uniref:Phage major capsid protein, HK97 family n=1 Tax=Bauldia litoralis TaxID=665467 RepID=A0A1G6CFP8_9HYPH|nr:phage major capsid protein [Bauldia litoralis]SDB31552.1 phage major capsid protein, HK97 family [Bauldia litoralis]
MTHAPQPAPEAKAADGEMTSAFETFNRTFAAFRAENDDRLEQIERKLSADVVTVDKVDRINRALDEQKRAMDQLVLKGRRPALETGGSRVVTSPEHKAAFEAYVRGGNEEALRGFEQKALAVGSDGGYVVPEETEREIGRRLASVSPIRAISGIRQVSSNVYKKPFAITGAATGWVGETAARTETAAPTLAELSFPAMELYAMPAATATLLDDSAVDIDAWIADEVETVFATQEGTAFVTGDGTNKPKGFLSYTTVAEASWAWDKIGYLVTGVSGAFAASDPSDELIDLVYALKSGYRQNAHWVMNRSTQGAVRKLKDADGNYIWQPSAVAGGTPTLMNFPVAESEDMPDIGADTFAIAFGDFRRGYLVVDRVGVRVLRDPYSAKPYVLFYTTKRVGGGVQDFDAIKLLKFGTS